SSKVVTVCGLLSGCIRTVKVQRDEFLGNGDGTFRSGASIPDFPSSPLLLADFNGDGKLDVGFRAFWVELGKGDGSFSSILSSNIQGELAGLPMAAGDWDGDNLSDI